MDFRNDIEHGRDSGFKGISRKIRCEVAVDQYAPLHNLFNQIRRERFTRLVMT